MHWSRTAKSEQSCANEGKSISPHSRRKLPDAAELASLLGRGALGEVRSALQIPTASVKIWGPLLQFLASRLDGHIKNLTSEEEDARETTFMGSVVMGCLKRIHQAALRRSGSQMRNGKREAALNFQEDFLRVGDDSNASARPAAANDTQEQDEAHAWALAAWALHLWSKSLQASGAAEAEDDTSRPQGKRRRIAKDQEDDLIAAARSAEDQHVMRRSERVEISRTLLDWQMAESMMGIYGSCR